jgi:hypothetical protein
MREHVLFSSQAVHFVLVIYTHAYSPIEWEWAYLKPCYIKYEQPFGNIPVNLDTISFFEVVFYV